MLMNSQLVYSETYHSAGMMFVDFTIIAHLTYSPSDDR